MAIALAVAPAWLAAPARAAGASRADRGVSDWVADLDAADVRRQWYATLALARMGHSAAEAVEPLMRVLADRSRYEYVRAGAAFALGHIGAEAERVVPLLAETLESELASVRRNSARAIGRFGRPAKSATPQLLAQLQRKDPVFRVDLAEALWRVARDERAVAFLIDQVKTPQAPAAYEATEALGRQLTEEPDRIGPVLAAALGAANEDVARSAVDAFRRAGADALPYLGTAVRSERIQVRRRAADVLASMGRSGVAELTEMLGDPAPEVRRSAARSLGRIGPDARDAEPGLLRAINDPDPAVRATAASSLKRISGRSK